MTAKYLLRRIGGFIMTVILLSGIAIMSSDTAQAQGRVQRRVVIVRPYRSYGPFGSWGFGPRYRYDPFGYRYDAFGYPYDPFGYDSFRYSQYVFRNGDAAVNQGYKDGLKTGESDGKKAKSFSPERSHYFHDAGFGNFGEAYRSGFARGYRVGYGSGSSRLGL
jgi:hypothetical protein